MIDRYIALAGQLKEPVFEADLGPHKAVSEQLYEAPADNANGTLTAVYGHWHATEKQLAFIASRLHKSGSDALVYNLHPDILNDDPVMVREGFEEVAGQASARINELAPSYIYMNQLAFSLGNVAMSMATEKINDFDKVTMVVPGTDLLTGLWYGIRTPRLKRKLEANGATYRQLEEEWADLAPINHIDALKGHDVEVVLSQRDKFIPYRFGKLLTQAMVYRGVDPDVKTQRFLGHALTIFDHIRKI